MFIRPDWRNPESYKGLYIAWEFLRRNPSYQRDFYAFSSDWKNRVRADEGADEDEDEYDSERYLYWCDFFECRWGVIRPLDANGDEFDGSCFVDDITSNSRYDLFKRVEFGTVHGPHVLIPVDLSMPLKDLEFRLKQMVIGLRQKGIEQGTVIPRTNRVLKPRIYIEYLRILDAFAVNATVREIGEVLEPRAINAPGERQRDKRIKAAHVAALKMVNGGYLSLVLSA